MPRPLTSGERDVLRWKAADRSIHEIAQALRTTERDVRNALTRAIRATGAQTLDEAVQILNQPEPTDR